MSIDYTKLAEQVGGFLNEAGKKALEIAVAGVKAEALAQLIPSAIAFLVLAVVLKYFYSRAVADDWQDGHLVAGTIGSTIGAVISFVWMLVALSSTVLAFNAPEWIAIKTIFGAIRR